jgi:hypothetical protein
MPDVSVTRPDLPTLSRLIIPKKVIIPACIIMTIGLRTWDSSSMIKVEIVQLATITDMGKSRWRISGSFSFHFFD